MPKPKSPVDKASILARNIWLAGVGAYGQAFDEAQGHMNRMSKETSQVFDELVSRGERLERKLNPARQTSRDRAAGIGLSIEERLQRMRDFFALPQGPAESNARLEVMIRHIEKLDKKIDQLTKAVSALTKGSTPAPARKKTPGQTKRKKVATKKAATKAAGKRATTRTAKAAKKRAATSR